jgi:hypothetical protein
LRIYKLWNGDVGEQTIYKITGGKCNELTNHASFAAMKLTDVQVMTLIGFYPSDACDLDLIFIISHIAMSHS